MIAVTCKIFSIDLFHIPEEYYSDLQTMSSVLSGKFLQSKSYTFQFFITYFTANIFLSKSLTLIMSS